MCNRYNGTYHIVFHSRNPKFVTERNSQGDRWSPRGSVRGGRPARAFTCYTSHSVNFPQCNLHHCWPFPPATSPLPLESWLFRISLIRISLALSLQFALSFALCFVGLFFCWPSKVVSPFVRSEFAAWEGGLPFCAERVGSMGRCHPFLSQPIFIGRTFFYPISNCFQTLY